MTTIKPATPLLRPNSGALALVLLFALFAFFLILLSIVSPLLVKAIGRPESAMRIAMVLQDVFVFILPAIAVALVASRLPARLLGVDKAPTLLQVLLAIATLLCSIPAMNMIIQWNEGWHLPESMAAVEEAMRQMEDTAKATTDSLMAGASVWSMIVSVLIVGVMAGFSEEIFFRGAFQRVMQANRLNGHIAVWTAAALFSLVHFQMFGFVPRMLLGAFFGYALWWTNSLWVPVIAHAFNNSLVVITTWRTANDPDSILAVLNDAGSTEITVGSVGLAIGSAILTACLLRLLYLTSHHK